MAQDAIVIDTTKSNGNDLIRAINSVQSGLNDAIEILEKMLHNTDGVNYANVATAFAASRGADSDDTVGTALYNLTAGAKAAIDVAAVKNWIHQVQAN